jgi:hypothetical protein
MLSPLPKLLCFYGFGTLADGGSSGRPIAASLSVGTPYHSRERTWRQAFLFAVTSPATPEHHFTPEYSTASTNNEETLGFPTLPFTVPQGRLSAATPRRKHQAWVA